MERRDYAGGLADLKSALARRPPTASCSHRLGEAYKLAGRTAEAEAIKAREAEVEAARGRTPRGSRGKRTEEGRPGLFDEIAASSRFRPVPEPASTRSWPPLRERMGHPDEALAWHQLVLRDAPDDAESREAVDRLEKTTPRTSR